MIKTSMVSLVMSIRLVMSIVMSISAMIQIRFLDFRLPIQKPIVEYDIKGKYPEECSPSIK